MKIFALSDLHLSLSRPYLPGSGQPQLTKPMSKFGAQWRDYFRRLEQNWLELVSPEDTVLIAGDISWAMTLEEAAYDLAYIGALPGHKIMIKGNHDYWWSSLARVQEQLHPSIRVLQHSAVVCGDYAVCGTRGWMLPEHYDFHPSEDEKLYRRERIRLEMALKQAAALERPILAMLHYPPLESAESSSEFCKLLRFYGVQTCIYGHLHGDRSPAFEGLHQGVRYLNCSMDRLGFRPALLAEC